MRFHFFTSRMESKKEEPSRKAIYRFFRDANEGGVDLFCWVSPICAARAVIL